MSVNKRWLMRSAYITKELKVIEENLILNAEEKSYCN